MIEIIETDSMGPGEISRLLERPELNRHADVRATVEEIVESVRARGDARLIELTRELDGVDLRKIEVDEEEKARALRDIGRDLLSSMERAIETLTRWHEQTRPSELDLETAPGVRSGRVIRPIGRVGFYIPAGTAPLPSTVLMLGVPARLAGCREVILSSPPDRKGRIDRAVLAAAALTGVSRIFAAGGAQAIAAMAFGTETIPKVDKIFGPGNAWVTDAKLVVASSPGGAAIDMPAGPSEVMVIADDSARPEWIAADLLSQAEHGETSQAILLTTSSRLASRVSEALQEQIDTLPRREIAAAAIRASRILVVPELSRAYELASEYAPEHLILNVEEPALDLVESAGSVFLGGFSPEAMGDYCSGTNHVLPTNGWARAYSGVSVASFTKSISWQQLSSAGIEELGPHAERLAAAEGLEAHRRAVAIRRGE